MGDGVKRTCSACMGPGLAFVATLGCGLTGSFDLDGGEETSTTSGTSSQDSQTSTGVAGSESSDEPPTEPPLDCSDVTLRLATWNIYEVGTVGTAPYHAVLDILRRIDADIVCMQEVVHWEGPGLAALANDAGYTYVVQADPSPAIGGMHTNACIARVPLELVGSYTASDLSSDPTANDVGRDILVVRARLRESCRVAVATAHLKAGMDDGDRFRKQVEVVRLRQATARYIDERPDEPIFAVGDFNESVDSEELGRVFATPPGDLPLSYRLGADVVLPLTFEPFASMQEAGFELGEPMQAGTERPYTWSDSSRLDYVFWRGAALVDDEVYNACLDEQGAGLEKAGRPLPCDVSMTASDHFPVLADFAL
jgi:endonuclease/exonuclease/phosphatase family metal-dependent hydrolase